jgi:hypothetical protein
MNGPVAVTGDAPELFLDNGGTAIYDPTATAALGDPTKLVFSYTIGAQDSAPGWPLAVTGGSVAGVSGINGSEPNWSGLLDAPIPNFYALGNGVIVANGVIPAGTWFDIPIASSANVAFGATTGGLALEHAGTFTGTIAGFGGSGQNSDLIDLRDLLFSSSGMTLGFQENAGNTGGTLTVNDGAGHADSLALLGQYSATHFSLASDGNGGTYVTAYAQDPHNAPYVAIPAHV